MDHVAQRQIGGIKGSRPIEVPQDYFNLTNCNLSHTLLTHPGEGSFPSRPCPVPHKGLEYGLWKQALRRDL